MWQQFVVECTEYTDSLYYLGIQIDVKCVYTYIHTHVLLFPITQQQAAVQHEPY